MQTWKRAENFLDFEAFTFEVSKLENCDVACDTGHGLCRGIANKNDKMLSVAVCRVIYELQ